MGTFYLLPTRAWELLCGAFVAIVPQSRIAHSRVAREGLALLGLMSILVPCSLYTKLTPFPGLAAVPPCFGTALFIWASSTSLGGALPFAARVLACRPVVFVGLISYSLYLWHWPLLAYSTYWALGPLSLGYRVAMVGLGFALAILSWRFVETPFRKRNVCEMQSGMFAFGAAAISILLAMGCVVYIGSGFPKRISSQALTYASAKDDKGDREWFLIPLAGLALILACASCSDSSPPKPPPVPVTDTAPIGRGIQVLGYSVLGAACVIVLGRLIRS